MAGEEMAKLRSERRRSRAGLNLHVNFNGGVVLLLGAAAGALLASAFAAHRIRAHKRKRGSMKEGIQRDSGEHLAALEAKEFVGDEGGEGDGANAGEGVFQVNSLDNPDASVKIPQVDQREIDFCLLEERKGEVEERSSTIDIELVDGERGELAGLRESSADISSSPANSCNNLGEKQLRYDETTSVKEECKASFANCKEYDEEDNEKAYIEEWDEREEIEENVNSSDLHSEQPRLLENKISQNLEMVIATSPPVDQDEMNPLIEEREPFFEEIGEAKKAFDITQNDSGKHPEMVIMEDGIRKDCVGFKRVQQDIEERDAFDGKMVEGSRDLCEQTVAVYHESSFTAITEPKFLLHSYICDNPTMIVAVEEKTQLEDNTICDLNDVIQKEKTEEHLLNGFKANVESSDAEENLKENEECPLTESQRIESSLEHDNLMACKENPLIQFQEIEPIVREEKACLDDRFPLSIESNLKIAQPIQDNNSEKTLEIEESHMEAGAEDSKTSPDEEVEEREDDAGSVQCHELETRQNIEAHRDKLERQIEKEETEIHKESGAQIKEEENEDQEQILKLSFDPLEKGAKQDTKTGSIDKDGDENTVSSKGKQQRIATKEVKRRECIFLLMTVATVFAVLAFLYTKEFMTRTAILENFIKS